jgi:hypothetical protein
MPPLLAISLLLAVVTEVAIRGDGSEGVKDELPVGGMLFGILDELGDILDELGGMLDWALLNRCCCW